MAEPEAIPPVIGQGPPPVLPPKRRGPPPWAHLIPSMPAALGKRALLAPGELERFKNLLVFARSAVEGYFVGKHKSPYRGSSVEFADYKEYVAGDEVSRIDWRAYGRSRRLFVRQYEAETDMVVYMLVDVSASMNYAGSGRQSKYLLAARVAAALAYLMIRQGDKVALATFAETIRRYVPPGGTRVHLHSLVRELEQVEPASTTGMGRALQECNPLFKKRGRLVILSDFWDDHSAILDGLGQFLHRRFEILLLHVVDPDELNLPAVHAAKFRDMETDQMVTVEAEEIRAAYREQVRRHIDDLARESNQRRIRHALVRTEQPYLDAIEAYLGFRKPNPDLAR